MLITIDVVFSLLNFHAFQSTDRKFPQRSLAIFLFLAATVRHSLLIKKTFLQRSELELKSFEKFLMFSFWFVRDKIAVEGRLLFDDLFVDSFVHFAFISFADLLLKTR